jgi:hypothetical protein
MNRPRAALTSPLTGLLNCTDCHSQTRMTNDEIRRNDEIRMTKPAIAELRAFRHSGFGFLSSFVIRHSTTCASLVHGPNACGKTKGAFHEPARPSICGLPWESSAEDARTPDASRLPGVSEPREASGVRPIYRRFPPGVRRPAVHGPNACGKRKRAPLRSPLAGSCGSFLRRVN